MDQDELQDFLKKGISKAQFLCSKQEKCISEIIKKLYDWRIPSIVHDEIIESLLEDKFIDETRFTELYVKDKFRFNRWGKIKISYNLRQKNIKSSIIAEFIANIDKDEYINTAKDLMTYKFNSIKEEDPYKLKSKIFRYMQAKGFESDIVINMYDGLISSVL